MVEAESRFVLDCSAKRGYCFHKKKSIKLCLLLDMLVTRLVRASLVSNGLIASEKSVIYWSMR